MLMPKSDQRRVDLDGATAIAISGDRGWEAELSAGTGRYDVATGTRLLDRLVGSVARAGGGHLRWRVAEATPEHHRIARDNGFAGQRRLVQLRRSLPTPWRSDLEVRPFDAARDTDEWLRVNNAAFAWHPEQSAWTADHLGQRVAEPWFDPAGLLVHPVEGPMLGFCWTKVHRELTPAIGEIYVIGVDPAVHGTGLGKGLVLAGLDHLAATGLNEAMLYTEADNGPALGLYERLGFSTHHQIVVFERLVEPAADSDADTHG
jgi:mycothiol synthase